MKRISLLGGLKDRTLAEKALVEEYSLKQIIQAVDNRESSRANAEALRNRPTGNVNRLDKVEGQYKGSSLEARMNHLQEEMEEVMKLRQIGKYSGRHKGEGEREQCMYERHKAGQKCLAEERTCNTCGDRGHFGMSKMCKKKKKDVRRVKKEKKETTSEDSNTEEEMEVNRVVRDKVWPGTSSKARKRNVRHITLVNSKDEGTGVLCMPRARARGVSCMPRTRARGEPCMPRVRAGGGM